MSEHKTQPIIILCLLGAVSPRIVRYCAAHRACWGLTGDVCRQESGENILMEQLRQSLHAYKLHSRVLVITWLPSEVFSFLFSHLPPVVWSWPGNSNIGAREAKYWFPHQATFSLTSTCSNHCGIKFKLWGFSLYNRLSDFTNFDK